MKVKNVKKILIISILSITMLVAFGAGTVSYANTDFKDILLGVLSGLVALLTWPNRLIALALALCVNGLFSAIITIDGTVAGATLKTFVTPFDILFNRIQLTDIHFFKFDGLDTNSVIYKIRLAVATWYYVFRILAVAILLVILIYVGIRMAISTIASEKANYKRYLVDWIASLALVFTMHYIIIFILTVNDALVDGLAEAQSQMDLDELYKTLSMKAANPVTLYSWGYLLMYCILIGQTFAIFIAYVTRVLKIAFLIMIAPLVTLTYSIDKMADRRAQAFETWMKEFMYTILQQPFQCIIYLAMVGTAMDLVDPASSTKGSDSLGMIPECFVAIVCLFFVKKGEKLVQEIFNFKTEDNIGSIGAGIATAAVVAGAASKAPAMAKKGVNTFKNIKEKGGLIGAKFDRAAAQTKALKQIRTGKDQGKTFEQLTNENLEERFKQKAVSSRGKLMVRGHEMSDVQKEKFDDATKKYIDAGKSSGEAKLLALRDVSSKFKYDSNGNERTISKFTGKASDVMKTVNSLEVVKSIRKKSTLATGLATGFIVAGMSDKAIPAIGSGIAMSKGLSQIVSGSPQEVAATAAAVYAVQAIGASSEKDARGVIKDHTSDDYSDGSALENEVLSKVKALIQSKTNESDEKVVDKQAKEMLQVMKRSISTGDSKEEASKKAWMTVMPTLSNEKDAAKLNDLTTSLEDAGLIDFAAGQIINENVTSLTQGGLSKSAVISKLAKETHYDVGENDESANKDKSNNVVVNQISEVDEATREAIQAFNAQECHEALEAIEADGDEAMGQLKTIEDELRRLKQEHETYDDKGNSQEIREKRKEIEEQMASLTKLKASVTDTASQIKDRFNELEAQYKAGTTDQFYSAIAGDSPDVETRVVAFEDALRREQQKIIEQLQYDETVNGATRDELMKKLTKIVNKNNYARKHDMSTNFKRANFNDGNN